MTLDAAKLDDQGVLIEPLTPHFCARLRGVNLASDLSQETRQLLNKLFVDFSVLVVAEQDLDAPAFQRASEVFGPIMAQQLARFTLPDHPLVGFISNQSREEEKAGERLNRGIDWHTDHSNYPAPPKATILHAKQLPDSGGDTQYANMIAAYSALSSEMKERIEGLQSYHVYNSRFSKRKFAKLSPEEAAKMPTTLQPVVRTHPESGRKALYLNRGRMEGIVGMDDDAANELINELQDHATKAEFQYRHRWQPGDFVIWDNRAVQHKANADYDMDQVRYLLRSMIEGDRPV